MKKADNGKYWSNEFWSKKHVISKEEYREIDKWFYENIFFNNQKELSLAKFDSEILLFNKELQDENLFEFLIYSSGLGFTISGTQLDELIGESIKQNNYSENAIWFTAYQSHTYNHDLGELGLYSFERRNDDSKNGGLFPIFNKIIREDLGQNIETNYGLFSGIIGIEKKWILLISLLNEKKKEISVKIAGTKKFCNSIKDGLKK